MTPADPDRAALLVEALMELGGRAVWEEGAWSVTHLPAPGDPAGADHAIGASAAPGEGALPGDPGPRETAPIDSGPPGAASGDPGPPHDEVVGRLRASVGDPGLLVQTALQEHRDWEELWKVGLEPRRITDRLVVTPSWKTPDTRPGDLVVTVDPKMAFGNAEHGTTRGCMRILDGLVRPGDRLLDIGAGSAILSIVGALLGAASAHAVEGDPLAIETARENAEMNGVADRVTVEERFVTAADVAACGEHDGVIANIEAGLLRPLFDGLVAATRPGGWLLLSGILDHEADAIRDEVAALGMSPDVVDADGEWRSLLFRRPA